jgi:hypothetical protein
VRDLPRWLLAVVACASVLLMVIGPLASWAHAGFTILNGIEALDDTSIVLGAAVAAGLLLFPYVAAQLVPRVRRRGRRGTDDPLTAMLAGLVAVLATIEGRGDVAERSARRAGALFVAPRVPWGLDVATAGSIGLTAVGVAILVELRWSGRRS